MTGVEFLTRFEIMHIKDNENLWNRWELYGNLMMHVFKTHPFNKELGYIVESQMPRSSVKKSAIACGKS